MTCKMDYTIDLIESISLVSSKASLPISLPATNINIYAYLLKKAYMLPWHLINLQVGAIYIHIHMKRSIHASKLASGTLGVHFSTRCHDIRRGRDEEP